MHPFPIRCALRAVAALALIAATGFAVAGKSNNTLNVAFPREVLTLDGLYSNLRENDILSLVVDDALFTVNPETLQPQPLAALSHKIVDDRTIDVELRRGVKFHDGSEMTAEDVAYSFNWTIDPKSGSNFTRRIAFWLENATATGPYTRCASRLKAPYAMFLYDLRITRRSGRKAPTTRRRAATTRGAVLEVEQQRPVSRDRVPPRRSASRCSGSRTIARTARRAWRRSRTS